MTTKQKEHAEKKNMQTEQTTQDAIRAALIPVYSAMGAIRQLIGAPDLLEETRRVVEEERHRRELVENELGALRAQMRMALGVAAGPIPTPTEVSDDKSKRPRADMLEVRGAPAAKGKSKGKGGRKTKPAKPAKKTSGRKPNPGMQSYITKHHKTVSDRAIAEIYGVSPNTVRGNRVRLGFPRNEQLPRKGPFPTPPPKI